ncbi:1-deoxy-D-xylulose-5-phosphate reductoisomerase [Chloroflexota bacterium]
MGTAVKKIVVLGSTGSIGQQTLEVVRSLPNSFRITGLAAGSNANLLAGQINEFNPEFIYLGDKANIPQLPDSGYEFLSLEDMACHPEVDIVVVATSGRAALKAVLAAVKSGKTIALANKEPLVIAGEIIMAEAKRNNARILPVDSEHSAIWQCVHGETQSPPARIILTASGGPFKDYSAEEMNGITVEQALNHPSWKMGKKVTIDSATLMNKGLEIIEARWLFDMPINDIAVIIHPQSIIHSMVEFADGSIKAQLSNPDMRLPIQYALSYPERLHNPEIRKIDWNVIRSLTFEQPNFTAFPCLNLAIEAGKTGGTCPTVLSAADEIAVDLFLSKRIKFTDIAVIVEKTLAEHKTISTPSLEELVTADAWARERALVNGDN